jgi:hypothetical protein
LLNDDLASVATTGAGVAPGGVALDFAAVEKMLGSDKAYDWLEKREGAKATYDATAGLELLTPGEIGKRLNDVKPKPGEEGFAAKQEAYVAAQKKAQAVLEERNTNPAQAVDRAYPEIAAMAQDVKLDDPASLAGLMQARTAAQTALGIAPARQLPLTDGEAKAIAGVMAQSPDAAVQMAKVLATASGNKADQVLRQISDHGPALAAAVDLTVRGGSDEALRYIAQQQAVERDPSYKAPDIKPAKVNEAVTNLMPAFAVLPQRGGQLQQNAAIIFKAMARERGVVADVESEEGKALMERAMQVAAGAEFRGGRQIGGIATVNGQPTLVPVGMDAEKVEARLRDITDQALKTLPPIMSANGVEVRAKELREARLVAVQDGVYFVALGDPQSEDPRMLVGKDGQPWRLDIRKLPDAAYDEGAFEYSDPLTGYVVAP